ncbi:hypothetical protein CR513_38452, partial [Mucuna pruriens]
MIDATSGGALMDKTLAATRHLISKMAINRANIPCEAARCRTASTKHTTRMWNLYLNEAPYRHVPHFVGNRVREHRMCWSNRSRIPSSIPKAAISPESESRATYNPKIWTSREHAGSESKKLSTTGSEIPSAIILPMTTTTSATR